MPLGISKNLFERIVSALLLLPPVLGAVYMGEWWFAVLLMAGGVFMAIEWVHLTSAGSRTVGYFLAAVMIALVAATEVTEPSAVLALTGLLFVCLLGALFIRVLNQKKLGWWVIGLAYVGLPLVSLWWLREINALLVLWVFLIVWATDIGGYFAGKGIGGPKLAPRVSPKKTWAGLIGGMALSAFITVVLDYIVPLGPSSLALMLLANGFAVWSQIGDLFESGVKRSFGVKDSGGLIPGHGGLLDRVDGLVFVAPAMVFVVQWMPDLFKVAN